MLTAARKRPLCAICVLLMVLIFLAKAAGLPLFGAPPDNPLLQAAIEQGSTVRVTGMISDRVEKKRSVQYILTNSYLQSEKQTIPLHTISMFSTKEDALPAGSVLLVSGTLSLPEQASNPGQFDLRSYYASQRIYYTLFAESCRILSPGRGVREKMLVCKNRLSERIDTIADEDTAELMKAILLGDRTGLTNDTKRSYQVGGILHILAISGMHISFFGQGLLKMLQKARMPFPLAAGISFSLLAGYCVFAGAAPSAVRAVCMFAVFLGARLLLRTYDSLCALALAGILMLLENPGVLFSSGFQLSFCAILAVSLVWPAVSWLLPKQVRKPGKLFRKSGIGKQERRELIRRSAAGWCKYGYRLFLRYAFFWITINASMLPLTAWYYYEIPIWGLLPNLLLVPAAPILLTAGMIGILLGVFSLRLGQIPLLPVSGILAVFQMITGLIRSLPFSTFVCGKPEIWQIVVTCFLFLVVSGILLQIRTALENRKLSGKQKKQEQEKCRKIAAAGLFLGLFLLLFRFEPRWSLTMLDVGQGDCLVLRGRQTCFMIDGGSSSVKEAGSYRIIPYLKSQGISTLEGIFVTHPDEDHMNGVAELLEAIQDRTVTMKVKKLFLPEWMKGSEEEKKLIQLAEKAGAVPIYLARGDTIAAESMEISVLNPFRESGSQSGNSGSLVLSVACGSFDALLTGDLESDGEAVLLPLDHTYSYLKAAHHGSKGSSSEHFLQQVQPKVTVVSAPLNSRYGHPHQEAMERFRNVGSEIYVTRDCGAIRVEGNRKSWRLRGYLSTDNAAEHM